MKIVLFGSGPWPTEPGALATGPNIRLRRFALPLLAAGHRVTAVMMEAAPRSGVKIDGLDAAEAFVSEDMARPEVIAARIDARGAEAVFGVGSLMPAWGATKLARHLDLPCWVDHNGDPLTENHAALLRTGDAPDMRMRDLVWNLYRESLTGGDAFSAVSGPQRHALLGHLGLLGRYGAFADASRRVHVVPNGLAKEVVEFSPLPPWPLALAERGLAAGTRYVLFSGTWNAWHDGATMGRAAAMALRADAGLHLVLAGLPTGAIGAQVRADFMAALGESVRVVELPPPLAPEEAALLAHAGACLSMDRMIPEAELGARNRMLPMVRWGAFPVVTPVAEIERQLCAAGMAMAAQVGDADGAAQALVALASRSPELRERDRRAGVDWLAGAVFERTLEPALAWLADGAPRWPSMAGEGLVDRWAQLAPERIDGGGGTPPPRKRFWPFG